MARLILRVDGGISVYPDAMDTLPLTVGDVQIVAYSEPTYAALHQQMSEASKLLTWNAVTRAVALDGQVIIDSAWIDARQTENNTAQQNQQTDTSERATLLQLAESALTQIASDRAAIAQGKIALANAATFAAAKPIVNGMLDIEDNTLNRQEKLVKAVRAMLRNGLG
jgi:hypothetical protein